MNQRTKRIITLVLAVFMLLTLASAAFATESTGQTPISVQLDGKILPLNDPSPIMKDDRNFLPFRSILEALGATVSYNADTQTVQAVRDDLTLQFVIGETDMTVTTDGVSNIIKTDAPSFEQGGYTYIPVRFAAEALGCKVGWDEENQTVLIVDIDKLIEPYEGKFTLMDKLLDYNAQYSENPYAFTGTMDIDCSITEMGATTPFSGSGTISGISDAEGAEMNLQMNMDWSALLTNLSEEEKNDPTLALMLEQIKTIQIDYIVNLENGKYYMRSPLFASITGAADNAWLMMDMNTMMEKAGLGSMASWMNMVTEADTTDYFALVANIIPLTSVTDYADMSQLLGLIENTIGDSAFTQNGNSYTAQFETEQDGISITFDCTLETKNDTVTSYQFNLTAGGEDIGQWEINASQDTSDQVKMTMSGNMPGSLEMDINMTMQYTETTKEPLRVPAAEDTIVDFTSYLQSLQ